MDLIKDRKNKDGRCDVKIPKALHTKIRHLAYQNGVSHKEIIKRAVDLYEKATIFDNLVK